jgi:hypothetical protein
MSDIEKQLAAWEAREKAGPGGGPVGPGGFTAEELRAGISTPSQALPPDFFRTPEPAEPTESAVDIEGTLHAAWMRGQILFNTGRVSASRALEWVESRIRKFR